MNVKQILYFHSKYSKNCSKFEKLICIDSKKTRDIIRDDKQFNIKIVPCILLKYENDSYTKHEGNNAFEWIEDIIKNHDKESLPELEEDIANEYTDDTKDNNPKLLDLDHIQPDINQETQKQLFTTSENPVKINQEIYNKNMVPMTNPISENVENSQQDEMLEKYKLNSQQESSSNYIKTDDDKVNIAELAQQMQSGRKTVSSIPT